MGGRERALGSLTGRGDERGEEEAVHCASRKSLFLSEIQESVLTHALCSI